MKRFFILFILLSFAFITKGQFLTSSAGKGSALWHKDSTKLIYNDTNDWRRFHVKRFPKLFENDSLLFRPAAKSGSPNYRMSILGDSYSTYKGYLSPDSNEFWYADTMEYKNNLRDVKKTWWWLLKEDMGWTLEKNNSYSGATICNTGYNKRDFTHRSFVTRMKNIGAPDILFIFGGTNDCWAGSPLGNFKYEKWSKADLYQFRPAFAFLINYLKKKHPKMRIVNICNSDLRGDYNSSMEVICKHYQIENIQLKGIDKQHSHPSIKGMQEIARQIELRIKDSNIR